MDAKANVNTKAHTHTHTHTLALSARSLVRVGSKFYPETHPFNALHVVLRTSVILRNILVMNRFV